MFASLVKSYIGAIREGALPCVENAYVMMANQENTKAIGVALDNYHHQLQTRVELPTETEQELSDINMELQKEAIEYFASRAIMDVDGEFQKKLNVSLPLLLKSCRGQCLGIVTWGKASVSWHGKA